MNKHWVLGLIALATLSACSRSADVTVRVVTSAGEEQQGQAQLPVRLLPYDRDSIFKEMIAGAERPEPEPPADLLALRDSIAEAQSRWRDAEADWNSVYSELKELSERMEGMNQASNEYFQAYQRFDQLDAQERRLNTTKQEYFEQFTQLQEQYSARADSVTAVLRTWEDETFEGYGEIVDSLLETRGRQELADTTGSTGYAQFTAPAGGWWVYTRTNLPFDELYWNVRIDVQGGQPDTIILDESNADRRPIF